jgi:hypothetical protein
MIEVAEALPKNARLPKNSPLCLKTGHFEVCNSIRPILEKMDIWFIEKGP